MCRGSFYPFPHRAASQILRNPRPKKSAGTSTLYLERVNRAIDHILQHLDQPLKLEAVAKVACFSPFHFHRIFRQLVGEPLNDFVKRVRLERALALLSQQDRKRTRTRRPTLTEIALACGFASSADFSRCFKQRYGVPASRFDVRKFREQRRAEWQRTVMTPERRHLLDRLKPGANPDNFTVKLRRLPARTVAYIRVANPYAGDGVVKACARLLAWAERRGLADGQWLGYMWDDPELVPPALCRYDVGLEVPADALRAAEGEIGRIRFPAMQVAEVGIRGPIDQEMRALDWLFGTWLPASGYAPTEQPCFEAWDGRPFAHGYEHFELRAQIPVERA